MNENYFINRIVGENIASMVKIPYGVSNVNYLINNKYVVRLKKDKDHFYSYRDEKEILHKTAHLFLSETVKYLDRDGNKVSEYIFNSRVFTGKKDEILKTAYMLKKLHSFHIKTRIKFEPFHRYRYYKTHAEEINFVHEDYILNETKKLYHKYDLVMCHNDVVDNNLLFTKDRSYLIDYEFAGKNIYLFDLASFISENNIKTENKIKLFLNTYGFSLDKLDELNIMIMFLNLLWFYWALERYQVTKRETFKKIANVKKNNIEQDIKYLKRKKIIS